MPAVLNVKDRKDFKNSNTKGLRVNGQLPAVVYGKGKDNKTVYVDHIEFVKTFREEGRNAVISLGFENGQNESVMLQDLQTDPLKGEVVHADFYIVDMTQEVEANVFIHLTGEAQGVKDGGILQQPLHELKVKALPNEIPETIEYDISDLKVGDNLQISDLKAGRNYEFLEDEDTVIASILPPITEEVVDSGEKQSPGDEQELNEQANVDENNAEESKE